MGRGKTVSRVFVAIFLTVLLIDVFTLIRNASANVLWGYWEVGPQVSQPTTVETPTMTASATATSTATASATATATMTASATATNTSTSTATSTATATATTTQTATPTATATCVPGNCVEAGDPVCCGSDVCAGTGTPNVFTCQPSGCTPNGACSSCPTTQGFCSIVCQQAGFGSGSGVCIDSTCSCTSSGG
jgi:hypothetical protein